MATKVGSLLIEIQASHAKLQQDLQKIQTSLNKFGRQAKQHISPLEKGFIQAKKAMGAFGIGMSTVMAGAVMNNAISTTLKFSSSLKEV